MKFPFSKKTKVFLESEEKKSSLTKALILFKLYESEETSNDISTQPSDKKEEGSHKLESLFEAVY
jgi:hypothetical protein